MIDISFDKSYIAKEYFICGRCKMEKFGKIEWSHSKCINHDRVCCECLKVVNDKLK